MESDSDAHWLAGILLFLALISAGLLLVPRYGNAVPLLVLFGPALALLLMAGHVLRPQMVSVWAPAQWALLSLLAGVKVLASSQRGSILAMGPDHALLAGLGLIYLDAGIYCGLTPLLPAPIRLVVLALGAWSLAGVPLAVSRGVTLSDLIRVRGLSLPHGLTTAHLDPAFVGVNAFLICALTVALFDLFFRLVRRDWRGAGAVLCLVTLLFCGERYLLDLYDACELDSFRTIIREAVRMSP